MILVNVVPFNDICHWMLPAGKSVSVFKLNVAVPDLQNALEFDEVIVPLVGNTVTVLFAVPTQVSPVLSADTV